ncbi:MAG: hypothetical protein ACOC1U_09695 [Spirochaetota bacterium]
MRLSGIVLAFVAMFASQLSAQESVLQILIGSPPDSRLEEVLYLASGVELTRAGLTSRRIRTSILNDEGGMDRDQIEEEARLRETTHVLLIEYTVRDAEITAEFSLYDAFDELPLVRRTLASPIDIDLDSRVSAVVAQMIDEAELERARTSETTMEGVDLEPATSSAGSGSGPRRVVGGAGFAEFTPVQGPEFAVVTSGLIMLGDAADFFQWGVSASISGGYTPAIEGLGVTVGARSSVIRLVTDTSVQGGDLYVVTVAPDAQIGTTYRSPVRLTARLSGGAAIVMVVTPERTLAKTNLFSEAGVGARIPLGSRVAVGAEANLIIVFEPDFPLMGFSPSITVSVEP